ncbi:unnamed protein product [Spirodela intermedia]|uniref:Uncharacterized protein n=1 Tax=Spirodela intermedia TaxID=51605 RepID=A0A7I8KKR0_SPIIN|nr:unnamed protein product [Spirodela intermedia]
MDEHDKLHYFTKGLQMWDQNKLRCQGGCHIYDSPHMSVECLDWADKCIVRSLLNMVLGQEQPSPMIEEVP